MGYKIVAVNPLKPFPIAYFGLANVVSFEDAKKQIEKKCKGDADAQIEKDCSHIANFEGFEMILEKHKKIADSEIAFLEERWAEGKIQPALEKHLARQRRRQAHFESACRLEGCDNPKRGKRGHGGERGTKAHRPGIIPLFCGAHMWLRRSLTQEALDALHTKSANRVRLV